MVKFRSLKALQLAQSLEYRTALFLKTSPSLVINSVWLKHCASCLQERYEKHHRCVYTAEAVEAAVRLSARYIADRHLPDKAIDLLDEAGSRVRVQAYLARQRQVDSPDSVMSWRELQQVLDAKTEAMQVRSA